MDSTKARKTTRNKARSGLRAVTVNQGVVGSSPTSGAKYSKGRSDAAFFVLVQKTACCPKNRTN